jgi:hypothetical protein
MCRAHLQVRIIFIREGHLCCVLHLLLVLLKQGLIDSGSWGSKSRSSNEFLMIQLVF